MLSEGGTKMGSGKYNGLAYPALWSSRKVTYIGPLSFICSSVLYKSEGPVYEVLWSFLSEGAWASRPSGPLGRGAGQGANDNPNNNNNIAMLMLIT